MTADFNNRQMLFYLLCISTFFASLIQNIYAPIIPLIRDSFGVSLNLVHFSVGIFIFITAILQVVLGFIIDFKSQKNIVIIGLFLTSVSTITAAFTTNFIVFLVCRICQAIGTAALPLIAVNTIAALFEGTKRGNAMGTYQIILSIAPALAPLLGGFLGEWYGYTGIFIFLFVMSVILLLLSFTLLPPDQSNEKSKFEFNDIVVKYRDIFSSHTGLMIFVLGFAIFFTYFGILVYLPTLLTDVYHMSLRAVGMLYLPLTISMILGSFLFKYLQTKFHLNRLFITINLVMPLTVLCFAFVNDKTIVGLIAVLFVYGLTVGFVPPLYATVLSNNFVENRGAALGLFNFIRYAGMALGSMISGLSSINVIFTIIGFVLFIISCFSIKKAFQLKSSR